AVGVAIREIGEARHAVAPEQVERLHERGAALAVRPLLDLVVDEGGAEAMGGGPRAPRALEPFLVGLERVGHRPSHAGVLIALIARLREAGREVDRRRHLSQQRRRRERDRLVGGIAHEQEPGRPGLSPGGRGAGHEREQQRGGAGNEGWAHGQGEYTLRRMAQPMTASIDIHTHIFASGWPDFAARWGGDRWPRLEGDPATGCRLYLGSTLNRTLTPHAFDPVRRIEDMDRTGVGLQLLSPAPPTFCYWAPGPAAAAWCRMQNDAIAE